MCDMYQVHCGSCKAETELDCVCNAQEDDLDLDSLPWAVGFVTRNPNWLHPEPKDHHTDEADDINF